MQRTNVHPMSRAFLWQAGVSGAVALVAAGGVLLWLVLSPPEALDELIGFGAIGIVVAGAGAWCVRLVVRRDEFTVVVDDEGLRIGGRDWIRWTAVARLRHRLTLQRADLIGHGGERLGAIEYQVKDAGELIRRVATRKPMPVLGASRQRFGKRVDSVGLALVAGVPAVAVSGLVALSVLPVAWLVLVVVLLAAAGLHLGIRKQGAALELTSDDLLLQGAFRETRIPRTSIVGMDLVFERIPVNAFAENLKPSVTITLLDGTHIPIVPGAEDAYEVHDAMRSWLCADPRSASA